MCRISLIGKKENMDYSPVRVPIENPPSADGLTDGIGKRGRRSEADGVGGVLFFISVRL